MELILSRGLRKRIITVFVEITNFYKQFPHLPLSERANILWGYFYELEGLARLYGAETYKFFWLRRLMAIFGGKETHHDDLERAFEFAFEVKKLREKWKKELSEGMEAVIGARVGITKGLTYYGEISGLNNAVTVMGNSVNLASRIVSIANDGEILFSGFEPYELTGFKHKMHGSVKVKGLEKPVEIFELLSRTEKEEGKPPYEFAFVGRKKELNLLTLTLKNYINDRRVRKVSIIGEHGIGKTTLVNEFIKGADIPVYYASCHSRTVTAQFKPIRELLKTIFKIKGFEQDSIIKTNINRVLSKFGGILEEEAEIFQWFFSVKGAEIKLLHVSPYQKMQRFTHLFITLLKAIANQNNGAIFVFDDFQMVDKTSLLLLKRAVEDAKVPALFIFVSLPTGNEFLQKNDLLIHLEGLSPEEAKEILESSGLFDEKDIKRILEITEGNPFFIEELIRYKMANPDSEITKEELISSVYSVTMERIDTLPSELKSPLYLASIMGNSFPKEPFLRIMGNRAIIYLKRLEDTGILKEEEEYIRFTHSLIQEIAYRSILYSDRKQYHGIVASMFEELYRDRLEQFAETIAFHYIEADELKKGLYYTILAARRAKESYLNEHAIELYMDALELINQHGLEIDKRPELYFEMAEVLNRVARFEEAEKYYNLAIDEYRASLNKEKEIETLENLGKVYVKKGDMKTAETLFKEAMGLAQSFDLPTLLARAYFEMGNLYSLKGDFAAALINFNLGYNTLKVYSQEMIDLLTHMAEMHYYSGNFKKSIELLENALEKSNELTDLARIHTLLGRVYESIGSYDNASSSLEHAFDLSRKTGDKFLETQSSAYLGGVQLHTEPEMAYKTLNHALESADAIGDLMGKQVSALYISKYYFKKKKYGSAELYINEAKRIGEILKNHFLQVSTMILSSLIHRSVKEAEQALNRARQLNSPPLVLHALSTMGQINELSGYSDTAFENYAKALNMANQLASQLTQELKDKFYKQRYVRRLLEKVQKLSNR